jgi:hypothetical protein
MASWGDLITQFNSLPPDPAIRLNWVTSQLQAALAQIAARRGDRNVLFYSSGFLQKLQAHPGLVQITHEDINGFMSTIHKMRWSKGLTLLLHTPGGVTNAAETIGEYLHSKFFDIEVVVPVFAMSAGTMISLSSNRIIMGRQSQLGPIDPQLPIGGKFVSARAIVEQFNRAKGEVAEDLKLAHVWAPILQSLGPALLVEADNALRYGERMVARWLQDRMFHSHGKAAGSMARKAAKHFNDASVHLSHGRRIGRDEARKYNVKVEDLEVDQVLQESVLTAYHLATIIHEQSQAVKMIWSDHGQSWLKNA